MVQYEKPTLKVIKITLEERIAKNSGNSNNCAAQTGRGNGCAPAGQPSNNLPWPMFF